ncbi:MAG: hypothetical protein AAGF95_32420, partial [Chloroflexota bacterium]
MKKHIAQLLRFVTFTALLLTSILGTGKVAWADTGEEMVDESTAIMSSSDDQVQVAAPREWTMAELQAAQPYPASDTVEGPIPDTPEPTGPAEGVKGSPPLKAPTTGAPTEAIPDDNAAQALEPEVPYTYSTYPFSTVGMLFFTQDGSDYVCSAAVIKNQSIWTAGQCLHNGRGSIDGWSTNVVFVPQFIDGRAPLGQWRVQTLLVPQEWYNNGWVSVNIGGGILRDPIGPSTGWLGFAWNQPRAQYYTPIGYPTASPYNGGRMRYCPNRYFDSYGFVGTIGVAC